MEITTQMLVIIMLCLRWSTSCLTVNETKFYYPFFDNTLTNTVKYLKFQGSAAVDQDLKVVEIAGAGEGPVFGAFTRADAVPMYDPDTVIDYITASFTFVFQLDISAPGNGSNPIPGVAASIKGGTGVLFFLASDITNLGNTGYHWGMLPTITTGSGGRQVFGVEFDTHLDPEANDPDDNHVGLDFNEAKSLLTCPLKDLGIRIDGSLLTAWIEYSDFRKRIDITVSLTDQKPYESLCFMENFEIKNYVKQKMFVGFSALGSKFIQQHQVAFWTAETYAWRPPPPPPSPPPPSPPPPPPTFINHILGFRKDIAVAVGGYSIVLGPLFEVGVVFFFLRVTECGQRKMVKWYEALDKSFSKADPPSPFKKAWQCCCGLWICVMFCTIPRRPDYTPEEIAAQEAADKKLLEKCGCGWLAKVSATPKTKRSTTPKSKPTSPKGRRRGKSPGRGRGRAQPPGRGRAQPLGRGRGRAQPHGRGRGREQPLGRGRGRGRSPQPGQSPPGGLNLMSKGQPAKLGQPPAGGLNLMSKGQPAKLGQPPAGGLNLNKPK